MKFKDILSKRGQLSALPMAVVILVVAAAILVFGIIITQEVTNTQITGAVGCNDTGTEACGEAFQAGNTTVAGLGTFGDFWVIIVLAVVITLVIGLLLGMFGGRRIN